jgi:hypothetical protein
MLDRDVIRKLIARPDGGVDAWCAEHNGGEDALELVVHTYGCDEISAAAAIEAFRRDFDSAESQGVLGVAAGRFELPRYALQLSSWTAEMPP